MTHRKWMTAKDPTQMLKLLGDGISLRKLRLFAVACCRRVEHFLILPASQKRWT